jgi:cytochrome c biogenesis protein CcmG, thiol:disulfide interchange protein DsbE
MAWQHYSPDCHTISAPRTRITTVVRGKGFRIAAVVLLVIAYLGVYKMVARLREPAIALPTSEERMPFRVPFELPDVQGHLVRLADLHGQPVLINIWATWCSPCREEMPSMNALYKDYSAKGLALVAIATDAGGKAVVAPFVQAHGLTFPVLLDPQNMVGTQLQVPGIPTSYLLDKRGRVIGLVIGERDWNSRKMRHLVEQLLAEEGGDTTP